MSKYDIFISYSRKDADKIDSFCKRFDEIGINYWIDREGISGGERFRSVIAEAIENSKCVIYFSSKAANESRWTAKEVIWARENDIDVIPVKLDMSSFARGVAFELTGVDVVDYSKPSDKERERVLKTICKKLNKNYILPTGGNTPPHDPTPKNIPLWTKIVAVLVALCLVIGGIVLYSYTKTDEAEYKLEAVDLGLPSGTLWANMNVGASKTTDTGNYYPWGVTTAKLHYSRESFYKEYTRLLNTESVIRTEDDAAYMNMRPNGDWQMPTEKQFRELLANCISNWTTIDGTSGYKIVSKKNGNSIFLPAGGWNRSDSIKFKGKYGYYWIGNKNQNRFAQGLNFDKKYFGIKQADMFCGRAIRAVKVKKQDL